MILAVTDLGKRRGGKLVLAGVACTVDDGEALGVVGPNGTGKSTLLAIVAGVLARDRGRVEIEGHRAGTVEAQRRLGYVPEAADPPGHLTCDEVLALVAAVKRATLAAGDRAALRIDELTGLRVDRMSLGQRRRTCLAAALVGAPRLLVLDEPTNGLDVAGVDTLIAIIRARVAAGAGALIASHDAGFLDAVGARRLALGDPKTPTAGS